jgi:hypothetical protein
LEIIFKSYVEEYDLWARLLLDGKQLHTFKNHISCTGSISRAYPSGGVFVQTTGKIGPLGE